MVVRLGERVHVHVRGGVHEVDGVGHAVAHRPLDRVHVVAERPHQLQRIVDDPLVQRRPTGSSCSAMYFCCVRVVRHRQHFFLAQAQAADVLVPVDELLHDHRQQAGLVVVADQLFLRVADVDALPAAAVGVLQDARQADVVDDVSQSSG